MSAVLRLASMVAVCVTVLAAPGCLGRSPSVRHYTLNPVAGTPVVRSAGDLGIALGPVRFPRYLERPHLVLRVDDAELDFADLHRWAGGFESNVERVLAENLATRLDASVVADPAESPVPVAYRVSVDLRQLEGRLGGELVLRARWMVRETGDPKRAWPEDSAIRTPVAGNDVPSLVAAHDAALGELADAIAARVAAATRASP